MVSAATIKQALGLEDMQEGETVTGTFTPEEEHLIVNDVDVTELVDEIRKESEVNTSLESIAEGFFSLHKKILATSLEAFDEPASQMMYCAIQANYGAAGTEVPKAIQQAYTENDPAGTLAISLEASSGLISKIADAVSKGILWLIEKLKELYKKIVNRVVELEPFIDRAIARVAEFAKNHSKADVKLDYQAVARLGHRGKINDGDFARDIGELVRVGKYITQDALKEIDGFTTKVQADIKKVENSDQLFSALTEECIAVSPKGKNLAGNYIGDYDGELSDDVFTFTFSGKSISKLNPVSVAISPRNVISALQACKALGEISKYETKRLDIISNEQAKTHLQLAEAEAKEGFGSTRNSANLYNRTVRARLTNVAAFTVHSTKVIQSLIMIAKQMNLEAPAS